LTRIEDASVASEGRLTLVSLKGKGPRTQVLPLAAPPFRPMGETYRRFSLE